MREAAEAVGMSRAAFGRVERGEMANLSVRSLCLAAASVGLEFSGRTYVAGEPVRDAGTSGFSRGFESDYQSAFRRRPRCHCQLPATSGHSMREPRSVERPSESRQRFGFAISR